MITLADAKRHIHVTDPALDDEVQMYLEQATAWVEKYLGTFLATTPAALTDAATLHMLAAFYEHKGDEVAETLEKATDQVSRLLTQSRDPAVA